MIDLKIKLLDKNAILPYKTTEYAAGFDIVSNEDIAINCGDIALVSTGFAMEIPHGYEAQIRPRSGLACKHGVTVVNSPGTIDSDYRGEVKIGLINLSKKSFHIEKGMRIAQMIISSLVDVKVIEAEILSNTDRGSGGFGSTGIK